MKKVLFILPGIFAKSGKQKFYNIIYDQYKNLNDYEIYFPEFKWRTAKRNYHKYFINFMTNELRPFRDNYEISFATSSFTGPLLTLLLNKKWNIKNVIMNCPTFSFKDDECRRKYMENNIASDRYNFIEPKSYNKEIIKVFKKIENITIPSEISIFINIADRDWLAKKEDIPENVMKNVKSIANIPNANHIFSLPKSLLDSLSDNEIENKKNELYQSLSEHNKKIIENL